MIRFALKVLLVTSVLWSAASALAASVAERLVTLDTRPGVSQKFLLLAPAKPTAAVILFAGGYGSLKLAGSTGQPEVGWGKNNFLVRTRALFAGHDLLTAVVDAPSDCQDSDGMSRGFRTSAEHCRDVEAVVGHLKTLSPVPVWLVGTSRGTESAANCAIRLQGAVAGLVLTSAITRGDAKGAAVTDMDLGAIRAPVLVLAHRDDGCQATPAADVPAILDKLANARRKEAKILTGGEPPRSKPCDALSQHGFLGLEQEAVEAIATFIKVGHSAAGR